jgi:hypothetical protein
MYVIMLAISSCFLSGVRPVLPIPQSSQVRESRFKIYDVELYEHWLSTELYHRMLDLASDERNLGMI